jgi:hypothetical protein
VPKHIGVLIIFMNCILLSAYVGGYIETVIISSYSINYLVFITETECVYCAVRAWP